MAWEDLNDDEKFILFLSIGILGAIFVGAFLLIIMDGYIFETTDNKYDDDGQDDDEENFQYLGDTMMQSTTSLQQRQSQRQQSQRPEQPRPEQPKQPPEQPKQEQQEQPSSRLPQPPSQRLPSPPSQRTTSTQQSKPSSKKSLQALEEQANAEIQKATTAQSQVQTEAQEELEKAEQQTQATATATTAIVQTKTSQNAIEIIPAPRNDNDEDSFSQDGMEGMGDETRRRHLLRVKGTVVPRMESLPLHRFLWLSVLVSVPTGGYIMYFTAMGWGETTFYYMTEHFGQYSSLVGGATALLFCVLYLLDANFWTNKCLKQLCLELLVLGTVLTVLLLTGDYPYGPICCFAAITPLWLISCNQWTLCGKVRTRDYVSSLSGPLFFVSVITLAGFLGWTFASDHHQYNRVTKVAFSQATGCQPNLAEYPHCAVDYTPSPSPVVAATTAPVATTTTPPGTIANPAFTTNAPTGTNETTRFLHVVPAWAEHEPHDNVTVAPGETVTLLTEITKLNEEDDKNVYMAEETGVCFDTVVSPPAFYLNDGCDPDCPDDLYNDCLNAFILWAGPLLCAMVLFFLSFFCTFLKGEDAEKDIVNFGKLWLFLLFSMWLTASLAGVAAGLSSALIAMTLASFVGSIVFVATTRTTEESKEQGAKIWERIEESYGAYMDVARGLFLVTCTPFIFLYLIFSVVNQAVRKLGLPCSKPLKTPQQKADFVTKRTRGQINAFLSWDRTKVLVYAIYWGIAFMILQVIVSQFTVLFLSWLIEFTSTMNLGLVTFILVCVGMIMFLLPPVPGVPIYLTLGIVILAVGQEMLGLIGAMIYAATVSLLLKLLACTVQQKLIGENLAKYTSIRKMVGINSTLIKAMRLVLAQPGMGVDKVSILVGGPDWPTSVLCGIMGLDLLPVLFGTLPVFLLILPTMLTGSFTYMAGLKTDDGELQYPSASVLGTVFAAVTALVQFAAMIMAAYYLEQTATNRAEELEAIPIDKEVAELEEAEVELNKCYDKVTKWPVVPMSMKLLLYVTFAMIVASCYMVMFFADRCFAEYALTYTIDENLGGKWYNLVLPLGWVAIILFCASCLFIYFFVSWAGGQAKRELDLPTMGEQEAAPEEAQAGAIVPAA